MKLVHRLLVVALFTASCDVVLNFHLGGSLRLAQILLVLICFAGCIRFAQTGRLLWPRGGLALAIWLLFQVLYLPFSGNITIGVVFFGILALSCMGIYAVVELYGDSVHIEQLMRVYMLSYVFVAAFGMIQFLSAIVNGPHLLVQQLLTNRIARVSGFSYEPSYFATYMLMGWIMLVDLRLSHARIARGRFWRAATWITGIALFCSTSKTGWLIMLIEASVRLGPFLWHRTREALGKVHVGRVLLRIPRLRSILGTVFFVLVLLLLTRVVTRLADPLIFLAGSGLAGTPAHSLNTRAGNLATTLGALKDSPWFGRSLGGVPVYIGEISGSHVTSFDQVRLFWGFPVILDVLVASGVFGFIPFLFFLWTTTFGASRLARRHWPQERARWVRALARAMIYEWLILSADQNLLRVYLWFHMTMVIVMSYHLEFRPPPEPADTAGLPFLPTLTVLEVSAGV